MPSVRFLCVGQTSTSFSAFTLSTHFRGTTVASPHRRSAVPTYPPHGLDVFPRHAAEGLATTRHPVLNLSQSYLPIQVIGPIPHPPTTGKPLQAHHNPSLCAHRNRCLHLAAICIISIMAVINIGNSISVMPLDCAMRATPTPGTSTPTSHRALRDRGPRDYFTLGHNNLTVTSSVNR